MFSGHTFGLRRRENKPDKVCGLIGTTSIVLPSQIQEESKPNTGNSVGFNRTISVASLDLERFRLPRKAVLLLKAHHSLNFTAKYADNDSLLNLRTGRVCRSNGRGKRNPLLSPGLKTKMRQV